MIKTGDEYRESINTGREIYIDGEQVHDVTKHPMFKPIVDVRARIYDLAHEAATQDVMSYVDDERRAQRDRQQNAADPTGLAGQAPRRRPGAGRGARRGDPRRRRDHRRDVGALRRPGRAQRGGSALRREHPASCAAGGHRGPVPHVGQHRSQGRPLEAAAGSGSRHAAARGEGDRRRHHRARRQVRDRRAYANQAFTKPTIANWGDAKLSDYAVGFIATSPRRA